MKAQDIEEIAQVAEQAITNSMKTQFAESFSKLNKKQSVNTNLIIGIVGLVIVSLMAFFVVAASNNNADAIKDTITQSVGTQNAAIMDLAQTIENGNADVIAGIDNVQTSITGLQKSVDAVKEQNTKIQNKVESLSQMTANADAKQIRKFEKCMANRYLNNPDGTHREDLQWCKHHLK